MIALHKRLHRSINTTLYTLKTIVSMNIDMYEHTNKAIHIEKIYP